MQKWRNYRKNVGIWNIWRNNTWLVSIATKWVIELYLCVYLNCSHFTLIYKSEPVLFASFRNWRNRNPIITSFQINSEFQTNRQFTMLIWACFSFSLTLIHTQCSALKCLAGIYFQLRFTLFFSFSPCNRIRRSLIIAIFTAFEYSTLGREINELWI